MVRLQVLLAPICVSMSLSVVNHMLDCSSRRLFFSCTNTDIASSMLLLTWFMLVKCWARSFCSSLSIAII